MNFTRPTTKSQREEWALLSTEERATTRRLAEGIHSRNPEMPFTEVWARALMPEYVAPDAETTDPETTDPEVHILHEGVAQVFGPTSFEEAAVAVLNGANPEAMADALIANTTTTTGPKAEKVQRLMGAEAEAAAVKAWREGGQVGDQPPTPNLDAIKADQEARANGQRPARSTKPVAPAVPEGNAAVYLRGKVLPGAVRSVMGPLVDEHNRLVFIPGEAQFMVDDLRTLAANSPQHVAWMVDATIAKLREMDPTTTDEAGGTTAKAVDALRASGLKWEATTRGDGSPVFVVEGHDKPMSARAAIKVAAVKGSEEVAA